MSDLLKGFEEAIEEAELLTVSTVMMPAHEARQLLVLARAGVRPAPCYHACESKAFEIEIRQLKAKADTADLLQIRVGEMAAEIERLQSHISEWLCDKCNCVHVAPKNLADTVCKCGNSLRPSSLNERNLEAENARLQSVIDEANAQPPSWYEIHVPGNEKPDLLKSLSECHDSYHAKAIRHYARPIPAQQSPAVAAPDEETNFCALKSIKDSEVAKVARAFWRRIYPYRNDFGIELPHPLPVEFMAHMATALTWVDREPSPRITEQDAREIVILKAIHEIEGSHFRTVHDHGASEHAQIVLGDLRRLIGLPMVFKSDLPAWDGKKYAMPANSNLIANQPAILSKLNDNPESVGG